MTLRRDPESKSYSADIRDRAAGRVHVTLRTTVKRDAIERYAAVRALVREGDAGLIADLRARRLNVEAIARCHRDHRPFSDLRAARAWPALDEARESYVAYLKQHPRRAAKTAEGAQYDLARAVEFFGAGTRVEALLPADVARYRTWLIDNGFAPGTVFGRIGRLKALYAWLNAQEERRAREQHRAAEPLYNPVLSDEMPERPRGRVRFLTEDEAEAIVAATPEAHQAFVGLGLLAGLRRDEARFLRRADIDEIAETIVVQPKLLPNGREWRPKTRSSVRDVPIAEQLRGLLDRHLKYYAGRVWLFPAPSNAGRGGRAAGPDFPISGDVLDRAVRRIVLDAGLIPGHEDPTGVTYHTFRHTFASWLVMSGVGLFTVSRLLGHSNTGEVERTYAHLAPEHRRAAILKLGTALARAFGPKLVRGDQA